MCLFLRKKKKQKASRVTEHLYHRSHFDKMGYLKKFLVLQFFLSVTLKWDIVSFRLNYKKNNNFGWSTPLTAFFITILILSWVQQQSSKPLAEEFVKAWNLEMHVKLDQSWGKTNKDVTEDKQIFECIICLVLFPWLCQNTFPGICETDRVH